LKGTNNVIGIKNGAQYTDEITGNIAFSYNPESTLFAVPVALAGNGGKTPTLALASSGSVAGEAGQVIGRYVAGGESPAVKYAFQAGGGNWTDIRTNSEVSEPVNVITNDQLRLILGRM
jgi:hypothetical protein